MSTMSKEFAAEVRHWANILQRDHTAVDRNNQDFKAFVNRAFVELKSPENWAEANNIVGQVSKEVKDELQKGV